MWDSPVHLLIVLFVLGLICIPYFVPSIIAYAHQNRNSGAILALNIFLGWTVVGWVVALVWALKTDLVNRPAQPPSGSAAHRL
jgi:hypothetical protein